MSEMSYRLLHACFDIYPNILWLAASREIAALMPKLQVLTSQV